MNLFLSLSSSVEGEYVPVEGDEVSYKVCSIPPKFEKVQAVEVTITHLNPGSKHETWSGHVGQQLSAGGAAEGETGGNRAGGREGRRRTAWVRSEAEGVWVRGKLRLLLV